MLHSILRTAGIILIATFGAHGAHAAFGGLLDRDGGKDAEESGGDLIQTFVTSQSHVLDAQIHFANAFEMADQVALLEAEKAAIGGDSIDRSVLEKARESSDSVQLEIKKRMEAQPELNEEGRAHYTKGIVSYGQGLLAGKQAVDLAQKSTNGGLGMRALSQGRDLAYVTKETPGYFRNLVSTSSMLFEYGKRNDISPPEDATALLGDL